MEEKVIPVIVRATGLITHVTTNILNEVPGKHNILTLQKAVVPSTAHIMRKKLLNVIKNIVYEIKNKTLGVRYTLGVKKQCILSTNAKCFLE